MIRKIKDILTIDDDGSWVIGKPSQEMCLLSLIEDWEDGKYLYEDLIDRLSDYFEDKKKDYREVWEWLSREYFELKTHAETKD